MLSIVDYLGFFGTVAVVEISIEGLKDSLQRSVANIGIIFVYHRKTAIDKKHTQCPNSTIVNYSSNALQLLMH